MKIKKIMLIFLINLFIISNMSYAKYTYYFEETIVELTRDSNLPICTVSYSEEELTNQNVTVTIQSNKEIEQVSGFFLSEDKKMLTKEVSQNESQKVAIRDLSGNAIKMEYSVENIDKEPPKILGCNNGGIYTDPVELDYMDNEEIEKVSIDRYDYELAIVGHKDSEDTSQLTVYIEKHPLNTKKYRYFVNDKLYTTITDSQYTFTSLEEDSVIKVEALDELGNVIDTAILTDIRNAYHPKKAIISENTLTQSGNYQVVATDTAGNMTVYYIKILSSKK